MKLNYKRRGRNPKQHGYRSAFWILVLFTLVICGYLKFNDVVFVHPVIASAMEKNVTFKNYQVANLAEENQLLRDKLARSAKIVTSDTQKAITRRYIQQYFGSEAPIAEKVFTCESNLNPNALNDKNVGGSVDRGVAQVNSSNRKTFEKVTGLNYDIYAHDTEQNIKYAKWLLDNSRGHWSNWVCYRIINKNI